MFQSCSTLVLKVLIDYLMHVQCSLQVGGVSLKNAEKFKYLGVAFTNDERQDEQLNA